MKYIEIDGPDRVYFIRMNDLIKIGYSSQLKRRLAGLQDAIPYPLELLYSIPGDRFNEAYLHWKFEHIRHRGEWFRAEQELFDYIETLKKEQSEKVRLGFGIYSIESDPVSV